MAQQVKFPASKPGEQNIVPRTHMVEREKWLLQVVLYLEAIAITHMHTMHF